MASPPSILAHNGGAWGFHILKISLMGHSLDLPILAGIRGLESNSCIGRDFGVHHPFQTIVIRKKIP
jgi:hypothetical protein